MVEKIPTNGSPKKLEELTPLEAAILNRILVEFPNGVELPKLFQKTSLIRKSLGHDGMSIEEFTKMILSFAPKLVNLKIIVYPKLTKPVLTNLPLAT